ncbi:hypothetical protein ACI782_24285 [Geodermatophilus sp. SYSU D00703]
MIVPLTRRILDLDFVAYRSSPRAITAHSAGRWPVQGFTREHDRELIEIHEREHATGEAFAYAILSADGSREVGCVYLRRLSVHLEQTQTRVRTGGLDPARTAVVTFWLIDDRAVRPTAADVLSSLREWLRDWGAANVVFRCLPDEEESVDALTASSGLQLLAASNQGLPYLWFADVTVPPVT